MINGLVIELQSAYALVLTDEGHFIKVKRFGPMIEGQSIFLTEEDLVMDIQTEDGNLDNRTSMRRHFSPLLWGGVLAAFFLIVLSLSWVTISANSIYAAVIVDINPSIQLDLNKNNKVVKLIALNSDALALDLLSLKGKPIDEALEMLIEDVGSKGFFNKTQNDYILITTVAMKDQPVDELKANLLKKFENSDVLQRTNMAISNITPAQLNLAKENKIPAGLVGITASQKPTSVSNFFEAEDNVKTFETSGIIVKGNSVDAVTSASVKPVDNSNSQSNSSPVLSTNKDMSEETSTKDLQERLSKLKSLSNPSKTILSFISKAETYLNTGNGDLSALTKESKMLWDSVKEVTSDGTSNDDSADDSDDDSSESNSNDESTAHLRADLAERLKKLKSITNPSESISNFIIKAEAYFTRNVGDLKGLTEEAKALWEKTKETRDTDSKISDVEDEDEDEDKDKGEDKQDDRKKDEKDKDQDDDDNN